MNYIPSLKIDNQCHDKSIILQMIWAACELVPKNYNKLCMHGPLDSLYILQNDMKANVTKG